jgi:hypothetical protein
MSSSHSVAGQSWDAGATPSVISSQLSCSLCSGRLLQERQNYADLSLLKLMQGGNKAAAGGDQIGSKKAKDADSDGSIPVKAVAEGIVTPNTTTDIDSSGAFQHPTQCLITTVLFSMAILLCPAHWKGRPCEASARLPSAVLKGTCKGGGHRILAAK